MSDLQIRPALCAQACDLASKGKLLVEVCEALDIDPATLARWQAQDAQFRTRFAQAREAGLHLMADSLVKLPDDYADVNKARLKSDNIKWLLARRLSRQYGDRLDVNVSGTIDIAGTLLEARDRTLQPMRHQQETLDVQDAEYTDVSSSGSTDKESAPGELSIFD